MVAPPTGSGRMHGRLLSHVGSVCGPCHFSRKRTHGTHICLGGHLGEGNPTRPLLISALTPPILWWWIGRRLTRIYGTERKSTLDRKAKCARKLIKKKGKSEPQKVEPHVNGRLRPDFLAT